MAAEAVPLFEVVDAVAPVDVSGIGSSADGAVAEHEAIARLLSLGHKVAVPVVDDDGVDLIVNYRVPVQVKWTSQNDPAGFPRMQLGRWVRAHPGAPKRFRGAIAPHVLVVLVRVARVGWYVVPADRLRGLRNVSFGRCRDEWREAWDLFERLV